MASDELKDLYYGLDRWPVTVAFEGGAEIRIDETPSDPTWTLVCKPTLLEFRNITEAEEYLTGYGMEPCGPETCGHFMHYRSDEGFARILFVPACIYAAITRRGVREAMERDAESLGVGPTNVTGVHHH